MSAPAYLSSTMSSRARSCSSGSASDEADDVTIPTNPIGLRYLPDFLTADECAQLIAMAEKTGFKPSMVGLDNNVGHVASNRTSSSIYRFASSNRTLNAVMRRVAELTHSTDDHLSLGLNKYEPGEFFGPHYDASYLELNPRRYTVLVYLNDVEGEGGETDFPELKIRIKPKRGSALFWENLSGDRVVHKDSLHQGLPPKSGVKFVLNCWVAFSPR